MQIDEIQKALRDEKVDGWLFFDHHQRDPLAYRILKLNPTRTVTRRWYYFIPAKGEPKGLVHAIESGVLSELPGKTQSYSSWGAQVDGIKSMLAGCRRIAMQYSPNCAIPYVSLVDGGTLELVRSAGVEVVTSANLVQLFEARWTAEQLEMHLEAGRRVDRIRGEAFVNIGAALKANRTINEWQVNRFIRDAFEKSGLVTDHGPIVADWFESDYRYDLRRFEQQSCNLRADDRNCQPGNASAGGADCEPRQSWSEYAGNNY